MDLSRYSNSLLAVSAISSANRILTTSLPLVLTFSLCSAKASVIKISGNMLRKSTADIRDPYLTPRGPEPLTYGLIEKDCTNGFRVQWLI